MEYFIRYRLTIICVCFACCLTACDITFSSLTSSENVKVRRFDRLQYQYYTTGDFSALQQINTNFPTEMRTLQYDILKLGEYNDSIMNKKMLALYHDTIMQKLVRDTEAEFANMNDINEELTTSFNNVKGMLKDLPIPSVYAQIGALDQSIIIKDGEIGISLDKYLGKDYPLYKKYFDEEQRKSMVRSKIVPDCVLFYLISMYPLKNFQQVPLEERDWHIGMMMWIVNSAMEKKVFKEKMVKPFERFFRTHSTDEIERLLAKYRAY